VTAAVVTKLKVFSGAQAVVRSKWQYAEPVQDRDIWLLQTAIK